MEFFIPGGEIFVSEGAEIPDGYTSIAPPNGLYHGKWTGREWIEGADMDVINKNQRDALAAQVRAERDALLAESDGHMALDNIGLQIPATVSEDTAVSEIIAGLAAAVTGPWARYRQALRNVPQQPGFPARVEWPEKPE